ncbi:DNA-directed RNA polymerase II [Actinoplanes sp. URMC 104]|uniref:DNA-directed RNA polymerase II n=1 Tax=Actinoplanes sp. URMC 104 TaxID=3423409 RepID=UPI003F1B7888
MPEQPQWSERTLDMPPQDPWADAPTTPTQGPPQPPAPPTAAFPSEPAAPFTRGRAQVSPRTERQPYAEHEPTGTGWPGAGAPEPHHAMTWRWSELRQGGEWTSAAVLFAFVCWGIWALSGDGPFGTPTIVLVVTLVVALGVFCLARLVGHLVLERQMGRVRRTARGSHLVTALFLAGVGVAWLQQTPWVVDAWNWVADLVR